MRAAKSHGKFSYIVVGRKKRVAGHVVNTLDTRLFAHYFVFTLLASGMAALSWSAIISTTQSC